MVYDSVHHQAGEFEPLPVRAVALQPAGGDITGITVRNTQLRGKCLEFLKEIMIGKSSVLVFSVALLMRSLISAASDDPAAGSGTGASEQRLVWVVMEQAGVASEGGRVSGDFSAVVPYEISCNLGRLQSARRSLGGLGVYGSASWTVRVPGTLSSVEGANNLQSALQRICRM